MSERRRRQFIAALAAGSASVIAGCNGGGEDGSGPGEGTTPTGATDGTGSTGGGQSYRFDRGNIGRTGHFPNRSGPAESVAESWSYETDSALSGQPLVAGGSVYLVTTSGRVIALDAGAESVDWETSYDTEFQTTPAVADGTLYVPGEEILYALDASSGDEQWQFDTEDNVIEPPAVRDGTVYLASYLGARTGQLTALDADDGSTEWVNENDIGYAAAPAIADGTVYYLGENSAVTAVDATGEEQWRATESEYDRKRAVSADGDTVYFYNRSVGSVVALNGSDGTERWSYELDAEITDAPIVGADGVFVPAGGTIAKVDSDDGTEQWTTSVSGEMNHGPLNYGGTLYVTSGLANLTAIDPSDGSEIWRSDIGSSNPSEPVLADGTVYVNLGGTLRAYE